MDGISMSNIQRFSGADMRCGKCNKYVPDRCTCNGLSIEQMRNANAGAVEVRLNEISSPTTAQEYLARWFNGDVLTSISMGGKGLGEGYEHGIQQTAILFLKHMFEQAFNMEEKDDDKLAKAWKKVNASVDADKDYLDVSGAMYGAARNLAAHFYRKGPAACMQDPAVADRHILVSSKSGHVVWL
jgi:bacterioferritin-associated ferredoxin